MVPDGWDDVFAEQFLEKACWRLALELGEGNSNQRLHKLSYRQRIVWIHGVTLQDHDVLGAAPRVEVGVSVVDFLDVDPTEDVVELGDGAAVRVLLAEVAEVAELIVAQQIHEKTLP